MDVAGDRVLSVFHRPLGDISNEPVEDAITFALWLHTLFNKVLAPTFTGAFGQLSLGIGIDYGQAVIGCVGFRGNKRLVFFGDSANNAAKLQDMAGEKETVISAAADAKRPLYLNNGKWNFRRETLQNDTVILRITDWFGIDHPPKPR